MIYLIIDKNILINKHYFETMENTIPVNSVSISLSEYNALNSTRDLLTKTLAELEIARKEKEENKIITIEKKEYDPNRGSYKTITKLELDIENPKVSEVILDTISKCETAELEDKLKTQKAETESWKDSLDNERRNSDRKLADIRDSHSKELRKLRKAWEEEVEELSDDKDALVKSLADLKKDKTQAQIELARQEEISDLQDKINAMESFQDKVNLNANNPFKLKSFLNNFKNANDFRTDHPWFNKLYARTYSAIDKVEKFAELLKTVGKVDKKQISYNEPKKACSPYTYQVINVENMCASSW
jgi:hypothetical protein